MNKFYALSLFLLISLVFNQPRIFISATNATVPRESVENNPGLQTPPDRATNGYFIHHTMLRIRDPNVTLDFYSRVLGMSLLKRLDYTALRFSIYMMGYENTSTAPSDPIERTVWTYRRNEALLELTHYWGTETDPNFRGYHNGNTEPLGYGHISVTVDNAQRAIRRFQRLGVQFVETPGADITSGIAFIQDPDGYWIEIYDILSAIRVAVTNNAV